MATGTAFNDARGAASTLQMAPPFAFNDVTMTVFPLQANLARLQGLFDAYLNIAPEHVQFRPAIPFVYLVILDYGRMAAQAANTGWLSQREVAFGVPLRWMTPGPDGMRFHDWAFNSPFIFVDNELSMSTGREVYGWPKLLGRFDAAISEWVREPHGARRVFQVRRPETLDPASPPLLSVTQSSLAGLADLPPRLDGIAAAVTAAPEMMAGLGRLAREVATGLAGQGGGGLPDLRAMLGEGGAMGAMERMADPRRWSESLGAALQGLFPRLYSNTINLKQFRDAADPAAACYQAITAARMPVERIGRIGMLGPETMLTGRLDGGYSIHLHATGALPLIDALGLVATERRQTPEGTEAVLSPVCPFWIQLDMTYGVADTLVWRGREGEWREGGSLGRLRAAAGAPAAPRPRVAHNGPTEPAGPPEARALRQAAGAGEAFDLIEALSVFNTTRGATEAVGGVVRLPDADVKVLPLKADPDVLARFVTGYLDVEGSLRFEPWGDEVFMTLITCEGAVADQRPGATAPLRRVAFSVPVRCYAVRAEGAEGDAAPPDWVREDQAEAWRRAADGLVGTALVTPFAYVDDVAASIADSEVRGVPTLKAGITCPPQGWAGIRDDDAVLMRTEALMLPTIGIGEEGRRATLLEVRAAPAAAPDDVSAWRGMAGDWGKLLARDLQARFAERTTGFADGRPDDGHFPFELARGLGLELLTGQRAVASIGLKQFRDAERAGDACYQALVMNRTRVARLRRMEEIDRTLTLAISRYPTQPIARILGLIPKRSRLVEGGMVDEFEPLRPFALRADLVEEDGATLFESVGGEPWEPVDLPEGMLGWADAAPDEVVRHVDERPTPLLRYDCDAPDGRGRIRLHPRALTPARAETFRKRLETARVGGVKLLRRCREIETLASAVELEPLDVGRVADLGAYMQALRAGGAVGTAGEPLRARPVRDVAGALALISPATALGAVLSRRWGAGGGPAPGRFARREDFTLRVDTFGPEIGAAVFSPIEVQDGYWPPSAQHLVAQLRHRSGDVLRLSHEFWQVLGAEDEARPDRGPPLVDLAAETLPTWFATGARALKRQSVSEELPRIEMFLMPTPEQFDELDAALARFFAEVEATGRLSGDMVYLRRDWSAAVRRMRDGVREMAFEDPDQMLVMFGPLSPELLAARLIDMGRGAGG